MIARAGNNLVCETKATISGHVRIENGDTVIEGKNKLTKNLMLSLANYFSGNVVQDNYGTLNRDYTNPASIWMYLGTNTNTPTDNTTTALSNPIGGPTKCTQIYSSAWSSGNAYYVQWIGIFKPGTVSGTVGELGLYLWGKCNALNAAGSTFARDATYLMARYAAADSEFTPFTIDPTKPVVIVWTLKFQSDNKLLNQFIMALANHVGCNDENGAYGCPCYAWTSRTTYMVLGSNTGTGNTASMTSLVSPIGSSPGTKPNTQTFSTSTVQEGTYKVSLVGTWNAGTVSGTVGEAGLYLYGHTSFVAVGGLATASALFCSRLSVADGHFQSFEIDAGKNLVITWDITFTFS